MQNLIGESLGRYHILEALGEGGMAVVYKAYDTHLEHEVAVKVIRTEHLGPAVLDRALKRFEREAKAVARLDHPNIIRVTDYGEYNGKPYLVMPYLPGGTLKQYIKRFTRLPWQEAARLLIPIAEALGYAHEQKLIHRDVKPSNIMMISGDIPMLTDFGVAKMLDEDTTQDLTGTAATVGTPEYMAPEQVTSKTVDHRADIYALGVVFFEMITGRRPYEADTPMAVLVKHASAPPPRPKEFLPELPDEVERVLIKALQKDPANRYQTMAELSAALTRLTTPPGVAAPPPITPAGGVSATVKVESPALPEKGAQKPRVEQGTVDIAAPVPKPAGKKSTLPLLISLAAVGVILLGILIIGLLSGWFARASTRRSTKTSTAEPINETQPQLSQLPTLTKAPPTPSPIPPTPTLANISPVDGMTLIFIPAGEFLMGSKDGEGTPIERPQHKIYLDAYWIDMLEVTNAQYARCVEAGACEEPVRLDSFTRASYFGNPEYDDYPVIYVNYFMASDYCEWAGRRLPTEAEWEKAARGTDALKYPWGENEPTGELVNFADASSNFKWSDRSINDGYADTSPVGSYPQGASPYGVLDMAGNVWEYVADWYTLDYYRNSPSVNPPGPEFGYARVVRGGSWGDGTIYLRTAYRWYLGEPDDTTYDFGIRCVLDAN